MRHAAIRLAAAIAITALPLSAARAPLAAQAASDTTRSATAAPDSTRLALARELLDAMQVGPTVMQGLQQGLAAQKTANPNIPAAFWTEFEARAQRDLPNFIDGVAPIYASRFSAQELRDLIAFYHTPVGKHLASEGAALSSDLMRAAQRWGVQLGADTMKELADKGLLTP